MRKVVVVVIVSMFLLTTATVILFGAIKTNEELLDGNIRAKKSTMPMVEYGWDIFVPDDYSTIQEAIDSASNGDHIFVRNGIYKENIVIDKEDLFIRGENKFTTVIDGGKITDTVIVSAPFVTLQDFTVTNGLSEDPPLWYISGIKILSSHVTVKENIITLNRLGISTGATASNLTIADNSFIDDGILLGGFEYSKITKGNFFHTIANNTVNGKPLYYYKNQHDFTVPYDAGQVILVNCTNAIIKDLYLTRTDFSVILGFCSDCVIENITVDETDGEIVLIHSENITIQRNTASNSLHGICLDYKSKNNIVRHNIVYKNYIGISVMTSSSKNLVYDNIIYDNVLDGIAIMNQSYDNTIFKNEIYNNKVGIIIVEYSFDNIIQYNHIKHNKMGLLLRISSNDNTIRCNTFKKNFPITATFDSCSTNTWNHNYWNRPRLLPKLIIGYRMIGKLPFPWINVDPHPQLKPYEV
jgi:parallel beta-helix repeat protein